VTIFALALFLIASCTGTPAIAAEMYPHRPEQPVKAAFMYSAYNKGSKAFMNEYDSIFAALGWQVVKFENTQAETLSNRLQEFDIVVGSSVSNYENPQDFTPHSQQWLTFLENGGVVICTDASYQQLLRQWIGAISPELMLSSSTCAAHSRPSDETRSVTVADGDPLLSWPNDLRPFLHNKYNWAHLTGIQEPWKTPVRCYDQEALLAYRPVGDGLLVVTSYFRMSDRSAQPLGRGLLENAVAYARCRRHGVELAQFEPGQNLPGKNVAKVQLRNLGEGQQVRVQLGLRYGRSRYDEWATAPETTLNLAAGEITTAHIPFELNERGPYTLDLTLTDAKGTPFYTLSRIQTLPEAIQFELWPRHYYPHSESIQPRLHLLPDEGIELSNTRLEVTLAERKVVSLDSPQSVVSLDLPLAGLPSGEKLLSAHLFVDDQVVHAGQYTVRLHPQPKVWLDERNVTYVDDEPFFPLGIYMVTWPFTKQEVSRFLHAAAEAGFNTVHIGARDLYDFRELLDEAHSLGLKVIVEGLQDMVTVWRFREHPAVIAWNSGDEPDGAGVAPETVGRNIDQIKTLDPQRLVYTVLCIPAEYANYAPWIEVSAVDPYPVQRTANLHRVGEYVAQAREAVQDAKPVWVVPQAFGDYSSWSVPTPAQERNMTYQALIEGANGLIYYTYRDRSFHMEDYPELWAAMKEIVAEVGELMPLFLGPAHTGIRFQSGPQGVVRCLAIEHENHLTLLAVNTSEQDLGELELRTAGLPMQAEIDVAFEKRTLRMHEGVLRDTFGPAAVHVYRMQLP
jgi:hypothetical protein